MMNVFAYLKNRLTTEKTYIDHWFGIDERLRFIMVGLANTVVRYLIFVGLGIGFSAARYQLILLGSWLLSSLTAFLAYKVLVFATAGNHFKEYMRSLLVWTLSYILNSLLLGVLVEAVGVNVYLAQAAVIVLITAINYLLFKHFAFKQKKRGFWEKVYAVFE